MYSLSLYLTHTVRTQDTQRSRSLSQQDAANARMGPTRLSGHALLQKSDVPNFNLCTLQQRSSWHGQSCSWHSLLQYPTLRQLEHISAASAPHTRHGWTAPEREQEDGDEIICFLGFFESPFWQTWLKLASLKRSKSQKHSRCFPRCPSPSCAPPPSPLASRRPATRACCCLASTRPVRRLLARNPVCAPRPASATQVHKLYVSPCSSMLACSRP